MSVLDTHAWIWWVNKSLTLSSTAVSAIQSASVIGVSAISCWEVAMLVEKGRLKLSMDVQVWINFALQYPKVVYLPLTPEVAVLSAQLADGFHGDPADRIIVASSLIHKALLVSKDEKIHQWGQVQVIW